MFRVDDLFLPQDHDGPIVLAGEFGRSWNSVMRVRAVEIQRLRLRFAVCCSRTGRFYRNWYRSERAADFPEHFAVMSERCLSQQIGLACACHRQAQGHPAGIAPHREF